ncbi:MAG TPA: hypothetical protein VFC21_07680 [Bryobacteraceae bacterium]|nr:hypothetical protein [Bryobacteraceae bacterium]
MNIEPLTLYAINAQVIPPVREVNEHDVRRVGRLQLLDRVIDLCGELH